MKKYFLAALLAASVLSWVSCSKEETSIPAPARDFTVESFFVPAYINDQTAQLIAVNQPIILKYVSKLAGNVSFVIKEGNTTLVTVPAVNEPLFEAGFYQVSFPTSFLVPAVWNEKLITISANNGTSAFTKYRVSTSY